LGKTGENQKPCDSKWPVEMASFPGLTPLSHLEASSSQGHQQKHAATKYAQPGKPVCFLGPETTFSDPETLHCGEDRQG